MPLTLRIESELDERSATAAASRAEQVFSEASRNMSREITEGLTGGARAGGAAIEKMADGARAAYKRVGEATDEVTAAVRLLKEMQEQGARGVEVQAERVRRARRQEREAIREAASAYEEYERAARSAATRGGSAFRDGLRVGMDSAVSEFRARTGVMGDVATAAFSNMSRGAVVAAAGIAGVGAAAAVVGKQLYDLGVVWDDVADTMALQTGRIGSDLDSLMGTVRRLAPETAASLNVIGDVTSRVSQSLGLSGAQLDAMTRTLSEFQAATGQDVDTRGLGKVFAQFDIAPDAMMSGLDDIYAASVKTQTSMNEVIAVMQKAGPAAQQFGLSFRETAGLLTSMESAGIDLAKAGPTLSIALKNLAKDGQEPVAGLRDTITQIKALTDAQRENEAINLAVATFGGRGYTDIYNAIKDGRLEADSFNESISGTTPRLQEVLDSTKDLSEQWTMLKNNIATLAEGPATKFFNVVNDGLSSMINMLDSGPKEGWAFWGPTLFGAAWQGDDGTQAPPALPALPTSRGALDAQHGLDGPKPATGSFLDSFGTPSSTFADVPGNAWQDPKKDKPAGAKESLPPAPVLPMQYRSTAGMDSSIAGAMNRVDEVEHAVAEKTARLNQLKASNIATAEDIQKAENDLTKAENDRLQANQALVDAQTNAAEKQGKQLDKATGQLEGFFASIDQDFGVSDGLAGIAENVTKFLMNLAIAPLMGQLGAQQMMAGFSPGQAGSGLMGMMANSGAFGSQFVAVPSWARGSSAGGGAGTAGGYGDVGMPYGSVPITAGGGTPYAGVPIGTSGDVTNQPGLDLLRSMGLKGTTYGGHTTDGAATDREIDVTDPTGGNGLARLAEFARQNPSLFEEFIYSDPNTGQKTGIRSGQLVGPGTSQPGYYSGNWAGHQDHAHIEPAKGGGLGFGDGPDGGGGGGNALTQSLYQDETGRWRSSLPGWDQLMQRESSGINQRQGIIDANSGGNEAEGLFQITPQTWAANGGSQFAPSALSASPYDQAQVAANIFGRNPSGSDWGMGLPGRENPAQLMAEIQGANPAMLGLPGMNNAGSGPSESVTGGRAYGAGLPASSGASWSGGGLIGSALSGAMGAAGGAAGGFGGGAAAAGGQMAMQLLGRAAGAVGQYAGNAVGGVIETLGLSSSPLGDMSSSWFGRIAGAVAGIRPALPNSAGEMGGKENPNMREGGKNPTGPLTPQQAAMGQKASGAGEKAERANINNTINVTNNRAQEDGTGRDIQNAMAAQSAATWSTR